MRITKNLAAFSFVAAAALSIPSTGALAVSCIASDTLQVGIQTATICEGSAETAQLSAPLSVPTEYTGFSERRTIALLEPGTSQISDLVTATLIAADGLSGPVYGGIASSLTVTLTSDGETPLTGSFDASITETGQPQNLTSAFYTLFFGTVVGEVTLPTIIVSSDVEVPEPASLAISALGWLGSACSAGVVLRSCKKFRRF